MNNLRRRIELLERKINGDGGVNAATPRFRILLIEGGLPGPINWAYAGTHRWKREAGEDLEAFAERAALAAKALNETSLIVGGLPRSDEMAGFATFEEWWATIAPHYSDIPPEEAPGFVSRGAAFGSRGAERSGN
jgi:hypothetical protein